ncbi:hypothetical protein CfE428DRAFT_1611 [Chthoniobacter flavus Ellin428]|uniref:Uncharacterized protein n=1 Tax=Chthoniobacter flavus Ellin428 TaxID=497964 RepID=B4CWZ8_9BACT|nr:hypothetical protein [Chthoniobacter flavus]EDY21318.1 hypothetical protein CfE428DRAFT_1611 [Chthoniobacter flavus Ellin428]TCO84913.1 hypothetical protein EV701_13333 [Chthoniobacter flavus]
MNSLFRRLREYPCAPPADGGPGSPSGAAPLGVQPTLEIAGEQRIPSPTDEQIRAAVGSLDACTTYAFLILDRDARHSMEISGDAREGFEVEHYDGVSGRRYRGVGDFGAEQIITLLIAYRNNAAGWPALAQWEEVDE